MMNDIFQRISEIEINLDDYSSDELITLIEEAQKLIGSDDLSDQLYHLYVDADLDKLIYVLNTSVWCGTDNGSALQRNLESWLYGQDENKIYVALNSECYPFIDFSEMKQCLEALMVRYPKYRERCLDLIETRSKLNENA